MTTTSSSTISRTSPMVWILVLHWNRIEMTEKCVSSLMRLQYSNFKVLVVDNDSEKRDGRELKLKFPQISVLRLDQNLGYSGGCNAGMEFCMQSNCDFIWLLNNDTVVYQDSLCLLIEHGRKNPRAGALGASIGKIGSPARARIGLGKIDYLHAKTHLLEIDSQEPVECEWLSGSNLLLRRKALEEVGLFDDDFFLYYEDVDLCVRLRMHQWQCHLVPQAKIEHEEEGSTKHSRELRFWKHYYYVRNRLIFFRKHTPGLLKTPAMFNIGLSLLKDLMTLPFQGKEVLRQLGARYLATRDFLTGRLGKSMNFDPAAGSERTET